MRGLFVTGTDTGVGKTMISTALLQAARARGLRVAAMKPVETGCTRDEGGLLPSDALQLARSSSPALGIRLDDVCPYRFELPAAPSVAAVAARASIVIEVIQRAHARLLRAAPDLLVVEGAGGLLVPTGPDETIADLARTFGYPILIVAPNRLGTINHTLLTIEVARHRGLTVAGVVLNASGDDPTTSTNAGEIERLGRTRVLGSFPHFPAHESGDLATVAEQSLDLTELLPR